MLGMSERILRTRERMSFGDTENSAVPTSSLPCTVLSTSLKKNVVELQEITKKGNQNNPGVGTATFSKTG